MTVGALHAHLVRLIEREGPLPLARYMAECLGHPDHGYYMSRDPFGAAGDFITAPEVSQMFGELIGLWVAATWQALGAPPSLTLIELGPGRGTLMADALRALQVLPACRAAAQVRLVEMSPALRARQAQTLRDVPGVTWHTTLAEALDAGGPAPVIVLANEFLDALPIHQLIKTREGWRERLIGLGPDGAFADCLANGPTALEALIATNLRAAAPGAVFEVCPAALALVGDLGRALRGSGGAALFIDYGHGQPGLGDTFQAVRDHRFTDPLLDPGAADLTAHVDFAAVAAAGRSAGLAAFGPVTQGAFLRALGLELRAARLAAADPAKATEVAAAVQRLSGPAEMGTLFKVLALQSPSLPEPPGFSS